MLLCSVTWLWYVCKPLFSVYIPCDDVYHLWEKDQDYNFAVLCNIDLWYDGITMHEVRLVSVCSIVVISVPGTPSLRIYQ